MGKHDDPWDNGYAVGFLFGVLLTAAVIFAVVSL